MAPIIVDIARTKAPGSVPYLELVIASSEFPVEGCLKDIPALQRYVDAGGTVRDSPSGAIPRVRSGLRID